MYTSRQINKRAGTQAYRQISKQAFRQTGIAYLLGGSGGVVNSIDFCPASLRSLATFTSCAYFLHGDSESVNFTLPTLNTFLEACSQNVSGNKQYLVARAVGCTKPHFFHELAIFWSAKKRRKAPFFPHPPSPFPSNFCNCNSGGICTASQF